MFAAAMILLGILSYAAGIGSYIGALDWICGQSIRSDLGFLIFASLFGFAVVACPAYVGIVYAVDRENEHRTLLRKTAEPVRFGAFSEAAGSKRSFFDTRILFNLPA